MKKIGIISELNMDNVNYGNKLQAFALNRYLNNTFKCEAESIIIDNKLDAKKSTLKGVHKYTNKVKKIPKKLKETFKNIILKFNKKKYNFDKRREACNIFVKNNIKLCKGLINLKNITKTNYDVFITGSDVVWAQVNGGVNRIKFLNFNTNKKFEKIAYAPSFGKDWIPKENIDTIKDFLSAFNAISVREKSSVEMLKNIGINNVEHVCDPTLLLSKKEWENIEQKIYIKDKYIFVYLLGKNKEQREKIKELAKKLNLMIIDIPHANGEFNKVDEGFGDYSIDNCSPEEWIWLIHNAEYIITDSFHGVVFSTIFNKKFFVLKRYYTENINNRMLDYLNTIGESDKMIDVQNLKSVKDFEWNYDKINFKLEEFVNNSKNYLNENINKKISV